MNKEINKCQDKYQCKQIIGEEKARKAKKINKIKT